MTPIRMKNAVIAEAISTVAAAVYGLTVLMESGRSRHDVAVVGGVLLFLINVPAIILVLKLHYRCWSAVPPGRARTTPGKAVGLLFIPFFNFYWFFESFAGLAEDLAGTREHAPGKGLGIALGILSITSMFPGFADVVLAPVLSAPLDIVLFIVWLLYALEVTAQANRRIAEADRVTAKE